MQTSGKIAQLLPLALIAMCWQQAFAEDISQNTSIICESPSLPSGAFHIVVAGHDSRTCFMHYLQHFGLTNAKVFIYRRVQAERSLTRLAAPCGMEVAERLLLPNRGLEASAFYDYILENYQRPPKAVMLLHGHGPHSVHTSCSTMVGRARLFYRGLADPGNNEDNAEFSRSMVSLTKLGTGSSNEPKWLSWFTEQSIHRRMLIDLQHGYDEGRQRCEQTLNKWNVHDVSATAAGFYTCCASFILPWDRILLHPKGFYEDMLKFMIGPDPNNGFFTARECFEFIVWGLFRADALTAGVKRAYVAAVGEAEKYDLSSCVGEQAPSC